MNGRITLLICTLVFGFPFFVAEEEEEEEEDGAVRGRHWLHPAGPQGLPAPPPTISEGGGIVCKHYWPLPAGSDETTGCAAVAELEVQALRALQIKRNDCWKMPSLLMHALLLMDVKMSQWKVLRL